MRKGLHNFSALDLRLVSVFFVCCVIWSIRYNFLFYPAVVVRHSGMNVEEILRLKIISRFVVM